MVVTMWLADRVANRLMAAADLCPKHKVFVQSLKGTTETIQCRDDASTVLSKLWANRLSDPKIEVVALTVDGQHVRRDGLRIMSDGYHEMFLA